MLLLCYVDCLIVTAFRIVPRLGTCYQQSISAQPAKLCFPRASCHLVDLLQSFIDGQQSGFRISSLCLNRCEPSEHKAPHVSEIASTCLLDSFPNLENRVLALPEPGERTAPPEP